jgi:hypothetical protein
MNYMGRPPQRAAASKATTGVRNTEDNLRTEFYNSKTPAQKRNIIQRAKQAGLSNLLKELAPPKATGRRAAGGPTLKAIEQRFGKKASKLSSTVLSGSVVVNINTNPLNKPVNAAYMRAWEIATGVPIATATQLAAISGGVLEVDALAVAARERGWTVLDAKRDMTDSVNWLIQPAPRTGNATKPILITKPKFSLTPLKKFAYGVYPPWGPPVGTMAPTVGPLAPNNTNWRANKPNRAIPPEAFHRQNVLQIARILKEFTGSNLWSKKIPLGNLALPQSKKTNNNNENKSAGKGKDSAETDANIKLENAVMVNWFGRQVPADVDVALECKVTKGKKEAANLPAEDLQLKKHTLSVWLNWYTQNLKNIGPDMSQWKPPPVVRLYFLSWFFGVPRITGTPMYSRQEFTPANQRITDSLLNLLPLFGATDPAYRGVFTVTPITPVDFEERTGLSASAVTKVLIGQRRGNVKNIYRATKKEQLRSLAYSENFTPEVAPSNYLNRTEVNLRRRGDWGSWLRHIVTTGWPGFMANPGYHEFAAEILADKVIKKLFILEQYYGMTHQGDLPFTPPFHTREEAKRVENSRVDARKFLDAFSILKFLSTQPVMPVVPPQYAKAPFVKMFTRLLAWAASPGLNIVFNWDKVPGAAKTELRKEAAQNTRLAAFLTLLQLPPSSALNYSKNVNLKLRVVSREANIQQALGAAYKTFVRDHGATAGIKNLFKSRINAVWSAETANNRNALKAIINRQ